MNYKHTVRACFVGYITQAIVNNFIPLLFLTLQSEYHLKLSQITALVTVNFTVQLLVDFVSAKCIDKIGYRAGIVAAHFCAAFGLAGLAFFPLLLPTPYAGIMTAVIVYAVGGGLLEVLVSPIVEACPTAHKEKTMSMLHSFYCWGQMGVVLFSTVYFYCFGLNNWKILAVLWGLIPACNAIVFLKVPIASLLEENETAMSLSQLFRQKLFWIFLVLMLCAGASELSVSQWASAFAEQGLGVTKTMGDLAGPMFFALMMGIARVIYGKYGDKINLVKFMRYSLILCVAAYLLTAFSPLPALGLVGCGLCGFSVGILWPGTFSLAAASLRRGGTAMFALLALAGDVGCAAGPTLVGTITEFFSGKLTYGILAAVVFPIVLFIALFWFHCERQKIS